MRCWRSRWRLAARLALAYWTRRLPVRSAHPAGAWRVRRGFNQAADLARQLDRPVLHALFRWRATPAQTGLTAAARRQNVRGAFAVTPLRAAAARAALDDRIVV